MMPNMKTLYVLLAGTALAATCTPLCAQAPIEPRPAADDAATAEPDEADKPIIVTGSRIRGARVSGDVITLDRDTIVEAGQVDVGEAVRSLPQNFSGGQNPGVGSGAGLVNNNVNSASSANLRGLGPDATLTLLNGHRLPYNSAFAGVDISSIPLSAIERVEVLPDGASAIYGSDAVAGVVNVVLRRDFKGITTSGQIGASTQGGYVRQQADAVAGVQWGAGGIIAAYDFMRSSDIRASERDYAASLRPETSLYPSQNRHALTISGYHEIAPGIEAGFDALYSSRNSRVVAASPAFQSVSEPTIRSFSLAPSLKIDVGGGWQANVAGMFGRDRTNFHSVFNRTNGTTSVTEGCFCNEAYSLEGGAEGPLFRLPGGEARLALGMGLRNNSLEFSRVEGGRMIAAFDRRQRARFAFGEIFLPVISPGNAVAGMSELSVSASARYEDYEGIDEQTTPRVGIAYTPIAGLTLRGTWGRSFKAPTLYQRFIPYQTILLPASAYGVGTRPETVLYLSGGNPDVRSERARSWTAGLELKPVAIPDLKFSAIWYDIRFRDRVVRPLAGSIGLAFRDPGYASLVDLSPDPAGFADLIAGSLMGLENFSGLAYDPARVVALFDNRNRNVAEWSIEGLDARLAWVQSFGNGDSLAFDLSGTYLDSSQLLTPELPPVQLAGTVFNPPRYRARGTARLSTGAWVANVAVNYTGALLDPRFTPARRLSPSATVDAGVRYTALRGDGREPSFEISLTVQNLFNDEPQALGQTGPTDTPYDSTNYSPIGRFIALGLRRHW